MIAENFELEDPAGRKAAEEAPPAPPAPKIVIEYRTRGFPSYLLSPLLIMLGGLLLTSFQRQRTFAPRVLAVPVRIGERKATDDAGSAGASTSGKAVPAAIVVHTEAARPPVLLPVPQPAAPVEPPDQAPAPAPPSDPLTPAAIAVVETPAAQPQDTPVGDDRDRSPGPDRPVLVANLESRTGESAPAPSTTQVQTEPDPISAQPADEPPARPEPTKEQIEADIRREAAARETEIRRNAAALPRGRAWEIEELLRKARDNRPRFHEELRKALKKFGAGAGPEIENLCEEFGRETDPVILRRVNRLLKTDFGHLDRPVQVSMMRVYGLPEPVILDNLANEISRSLNSRGGPRTKDEVWIRAARMLLTMPPAPVRTRAAKGAPVPSQTAPYTRAQLPAGNGSSRPNP